MRTSDDDDDDFLSFFLSFFLSIKRTAGKQNRTRHNGRVRRRSRADVPSLLRSPSSRAKTSERRRSRVARFCSLYHDCVGTDAFLSHSQNACSSNTSLNDINRNARSVGDGDETHHDTDQRNEPVRFAGIVTRGTEGGVLVATTRVAFGVEEFDERAVAENRLGEVRDSRVGVLLRVLSGDLQGVGDCG